MLPAAIVASPLRALTLLVVALSLLSCSKPCPEGTSKDAARLERLKQLMASTPRGAELVPHVPRAVCFGPHRRPVLTTAALLVLDSEQSDTAAAARLAHLADHRRAGLKPPEPGPDCAARVERVMGAEARAWAVELEILRALGSADAVERAPAEEHLTRLRSEYLAGCQKLPSAAPQ